MWDAMMEKNMILYEDNDLIVCHKMAGIPVQSARIGQKDMVSILNNYLSEKKNVSQEVFVVHRLDQPVEGVIVFAKNKKAAAGLSKQITDGSMKKRYQAVVCATEQGEKLLRKFENETELSGSDEHKGVDKERYTLIDYLMKNGKTNRSEVVDQSEKEAKRAELSFKLLDRMDETAGVGQKKYALISIDLKTGRHHQIRVQMSHAGLPLYGDQKYHEDWKEYVLKEEEPENELFGYFGSAPAKKNPALALCSVELKFRHPVTGKQMKFETKPTSEAFEFFGE